MRLVRQLLGVPDGAGQPGGSMTVSRTSDGAGVGSE